MFWRKGKRVEDDGHVTLRGYDDIPVTLGDLMRGERATMGKSILDAERELRIKADYLLAIENADLSAFDSLGFIPGYIRAYARYLGMDSEYAVARFCEETGFEQRPGVGSAIDRGTPQTSKGPNLKLRSEKPILAAPVGDFMSQSKTAFLPADDTSRFTFNPQAFGSLAVLFAVIGGLSYGGYALVREIQKVNVTASDPQPTALAELDPIASVVFAQDPLEGGASGFQPQDGMTRRLRSEPLQRPILVPRDGPIASLNPDYSGAYVAPVRDMHPEALPQVTVTAFDTNETQQAVAPRPVQIADAPTIAAPAPTQDTTTLVLSTVTEAPKLSLDGVVSSDNTAVLAASVPARPLPRPAAAPTVIADVTPAATPVAQTPIIPVAAPEPQPAQAVQSPPVFRGLTAMVQPTPVQVLADASPDPVAIFTLRPAWVRVSASDGSIIFEKTLRPGEEYIVPAMADAPTMRAGMAGVVYFRVGDRVYGPAGQGDDVLRQQSLSGDTIAQNYAPAQPELNSELAEALAMLQAQSAQ